MNDINYTSLVNNVETKHDTFKSAFKVMFEHVKSKLETKNISCHEIENRVLVRLPNGMVLNYLQAKSQAETENILVNGELVG